MDWGYRGQTLNHSRVNRSAAVAGTVAFCVLLAPSTGLAADVATRAAPVAAGGPGSGISAEVFGGYLTGAAGEYVYNVPGDGGKISQLNWQIDNAAIVGARIAFQPRDWLSLRASGWSAVASDNAMDDFDWLAGYQGFDSWTHWSHSSRTSFALAYQLDLGGAVRIHAEGPLEINALAGYRFMTFKMNDRGGHYIYSENGFRNQAGVFPDGLGIAYQQWWHTPYIGLGGSYTSGPVKIIAEFITSPLVMGRDKDHHNMRDIVFKETFSPSWMVGATLGIEYAVTDMLALTGRAEYQNYFEAKGSTLMIDGDDGVVTKIPKPGAGAGMDTLILSVGLKASL